MIPSPLLLYNAPLNALIIVADGQRYWIAPDGRAALGHARLSIIDLTNGDQPIANENERTRIIVNSEFYVRHQAIVLRFSRRSTLSRVGRESPLRRRSAGALGR